MEPTKTMNHHAVLAGFRFLQEFCTMWTNDFLQFAQRNEVSKALVQCFLLIGHWRLVVVESTKILVDFFFRIWCETAWTEVVSPQVQHLPSYSFPSTASLCREDSVNVRQLDYNEQNLRESEREMNGLVIASRFDSHRIQTIGLQPNIFTFHLPTSYPKNNIIPYPYIISPSDDKDTYWPTRQCHSCFFGYRPAGPNRGYTSHAIGDCSPDWCLHCGAVGV